MVASEDLDVVEGRPTTVALQLRRGPTIGGRVRFEGQAPPDASRLPTIPVEIRPADGHDIGQIPQARVEPDGTFRSAGLPPGDYVIRVQPSVAGFANWSMSAASYGGRDVLGDALHVDSADLTGIDIVLADRRASVAGQVRSDRSSDARAIRVIAFPQSRALWRRYLVFPELRFVRQTFVQPDGSFKIDLLPGQYQVVAVLGEVGDSWMAPEVLQRLTAEAASVDVGLGDTRNVSLLAVTTSLK
jgi:hypothetical protein